MQIGRLFPRTHLWLPSFVHPQLFTSVEPLSLFLSLRFPGTWDIRWYCLWRLVAQTERFSTISHSRSGAASIAPCVCMSVSVFPSHHSFQVFESSLRPPTRHFLGFYHCLSHLPSTSLPTRRSKSVKFLQSVRFVTDPALKFSFISASLQTFQSAPVFPAACWNVCPISLTKICFWLLQLALSLLIISWNMISSDLHSAAFIPRGLVFFFSTHKTSLIYTGCLPSRSSLTTYGSCSLD